MKAAVYSQPGSPDVLRYEEVADPRPRPDQLLIRVEAISIEGGDLMGRAATPGGQVGVLGYAAAGEILEVGSAVQGFRAGQKVTTFDHSGSHASLRAVPAATSWLIPDGLDMAVAAAVPAGPGTAAWALQLGDLQPGQTVLVQGAAGGVGLAAVQLAAKLGARVIGTGTNAATLDRLRDYGLADAILVGEQPAAPQIRALLGGNAVDLLIDNIGGPALVDGLEVVKDGGKAVLVGVFGGHQQSIDAIHLLVHRKTVIGCLLGAVMGEPGPRGIIERLLEMAKSGELRVPIDARFPLSDAAAAHRRAEERGRIGRVIMLA